MGTAAITRSQMQRSAREAKSGIAPALRSSCKRQYRKLKHARANPHRNTHARKCSQWGERQTDRQTHKQMTALVSGAKPGRGLKKTHACFCWLGMAFQWTLEATSAAQRRLEDADLTSKSSLTSERGLRLRTQEMPAQLRAASFIPRVLERARESCSTRRTCQPEAWALPSRSLSGCAPPGIFCPGGIKIASKPYWDSWLGRSSCRRAKTQVCVHLEAREELRALTVERVCMQGAWL
ncbi:PREDICTED: uncharacterized protein LOC105588126 isoform X2 [Cercocebus atys]|uniref:uncharacterized protein LOC105588126 isoform X2 n=1 Tax=Cercocebus atys TaxID=9531 RepID=UPI0005F388F0|nr:PREDICTED: uncharacterized protein LOC105588126 isoform X2 [Cercocebus atys]